MGEVLTNACILEGPELEPTLGYLELSDGRIKRLGSGSSPKRGRDLKRGFVLPPLVNAHTHLADAVAKELYLGKRQPEVVGPRGEKFKELERPEAEISLAIRAALRDAFRAGTLAHCDFREGGLEGARLLKRASLPPVISLVLGRPLNLEELEALLEEADGIGLPSISGFKSQELRLIARATRARGKLFSVHVAELRGLGPEIKLALKLKPTFLVHAIWASEADLGLLKRARVPVVFCPRSNSLLSTGLPPLAQALEEGVRFFLGTDNACVCQPDMFEELRFAWACLRLSNPGAGELEAKALLRAATLEPLSTFTLPWAAIEEGAPATFVVLARGLNLQNLKSVHAGLVNRARPDNVRAVYVEGKRWKV